LIGEEGAGSSSLENQPTESGERQGLRLNLTGHWAAVLGVLLLALLLRAPGLGESAYFDEVIAMRDMGAPDFAAFWRLQGMHDPPTVLAPVYFSIEYLWGKAVGVSVRSARLFSLVFGLATLVLVFAIGHRLFNATAGLLAMLLAALSLVHIYYALEIRMYALVVSLAAASIYSLLQIIDRKAADARTRAWWVVHLGVNVLLAWTHPFAVLLFVPEYCFLVLCKRREPRLLIPWTLAHAALAVVQVAWLILMWSPTVAHEALWMAPPPLSQLVNAFVVFAGGRFSNWNPASRFPGRASLDLPLAVIMYFTVAWLGLRTFRRAHAAATESDASRQQAFVLLGLCLFMPPFLLFTASWLVTPLFMYRYVLYSSLPLVILVGGGVSTLRPPLRAFIGSALIIVAAYQLWALHEPLRPDYAAAARYIEQHGATDDAVLAMKPYNAGCLAFNSNLPESRIEAVPGETELYGRCLESAAPGRATWVVLWRWEKLEAFEAYLASKGLAFTATTHGGLPPLYLYRIERRALEETEPATS